MNEPKINWTPELAEKYKKRYGAYPTTYKQPTQPKMSDKEEAAMRIQEQSFRGLPVSEGSVYPGSTIATIDSTTTGMKLNPYQQAQLKLSQDREARAKTKFGVDYKKSLLDLQEKEKKITEKKTDDLTKERSRLFGEISKTQDIVDKTKKVSQIDEKGDYVEEVEKPTFSYKQRQQAKAATESYTKRLQMIDLTEKLRNQGIQLNISDTEKYFKAQEKNIDAITIEMKNRNIPDRVAMVFKNTALQVLLEGNSKETAMKKAAEQVRELFPQYFK